MIDRVRERGSDWPWIVVWSNPRCDERALRSIELEGFEARVLTRHRLVKHNRTKQPIWKRERVMPRYLLVRLPNIEATSVLRDCDGVGRFLNVQGRPSRVRPDELARAVGIEAAEEFEDEVTPETLKTFAIGDEVLVLEGIAEGRKGRVVSLNGKRVVGVELLNEAVEWISNIRPISIAIDRLRAVG